jgi:nucleoid DNA-binding protein
VYSQQCLQILGKDFGNHQLHHRPSRNSDHRRTGREIFECDQMRTVPLSLYG